jgi:hypothetical protein
VSVGPNFYWLHARDGSITCGLRRESSEHGQREEELPFSLWATTLFDDIEQRNLVNHDAMAALRRLVEQDRV